MADLKLHRAKGFIFNTLLVNNTDNVYLLDVVRNATPTKTRFDFIVPKRNGSTTFNNRYEDNYIDVIIGIYDVDIFTRRTKQREILQQIVDINSKLIFLDEPTLFYNAEVIDSIEVLEEEVFTTITIHFKASYCKYELLDDLNDIIVNNMITTVDNLTTLVNTLEWLNISTLTNKMINNDGNYKSQPILKINANTNCTSVSISNGVNGFTLVNVLKDEQIFIDTEKMIVYKIVNGIKESVMTRFTGQFIGVLQGENTITINGTSFNVNVEVNYRNTYII